MAQRVISLGTHRPDANRRNISRPMTLKLYIAGPLERTAVPPGDARAELVSLTLNSVWGGLVLDDGRNFSE